MNLNINCGNLVEDKDTYCFINFSNRLLSTSYLDMPLTLHFYGFRYLNVIMMMP